MERTYPPKSGRSSDKIKISQNESVDQNLDQNVVDLISKKKVQSGRSFKWNMRDNSSSMSKNGRSKIIDLGGLEKPDQK